MEIICDLIEADKPTINGRIYPKKELQKCVDLFNKKRENKENFWGVECYILENPTVVPVDNIIANITNIELKDDKLNFNFLFIDTPKGRILKEIIDEKGVEFIDIIPNIMGNIVNGNEVEVVDILYAIIRPKSERYDWNIQG